MKQGLCWLHLSDFHFRADQDWRQDHVLHCLVRDVIEKLPETELSPDMVLVTGDIAQSGKSEEYDHAITCFNKIASILKCRPETSWYVVPGNHDVDRSLIRTYDKRFRNALISPEEADEILGDPESWNIAASRQSAFLKFTHDFLGPERAWSARHPWRVERHRANGITTAVMCLNSAWACQDDRDQRKILIGEYQVRQALQAAQAVEPDLKIALFHHPFSDLREFDERIVRGALTGDSCHFLLRGHLHEASLVGELRPGNQTYSFAAGACWHDSRHPHAITVVRLDPASGEGTAHVWNYTANSGGYWKPANDLYRKMPEGAWAFPLPCPLPTNGGANGEEEPQGPRVPPSWRHHLSETYGDIANPLSCEETAFVRLQKIFVPLLTDWLSPEEQDQLMSLQEQARKDEESLMVSKPEPREMVTLLDMDEARHLLIVGDPGSGKSTFARFAVLHELDREDGRLPILVELKQFGSWLTGRKGNEASLWLEWVGQVLADYGLDETFLKQRAGSGEMLWLLDGLDEIFDPACRHRAVEILQKWLAIGENTDQVLITTRPHVIHQRGLLEALRFQNRARVLPLDEERQQLFLERWSDAMLGRRGALKAVDLRKGLWEALKRHPSLNELRGNPLMLRTIAMIYAQGERLPERRASLYERAVSILLHKSFGPMAGGDEERVRRMRLGLETVARTMTEQGMARDIGGSGFLRCLKAGFHTNEDHSIDDRARIEEFARVLASHSGLISMAGDPPRYAFTHLGFQEYLTARAYGSRRDPLKELEDRLDDGAWQEVVLLTAGFLFEQEAPHLGQDFLKGLIERAGVVDNRRVLRLILALTAASEAPTGVVPGRMMDDMRSRAVAALGDRDWIAPESQRIRLGLALGRIGDPRLGMRQKARWVWLEPGEFVMGDDDGNDREKPAHRVTISRGFWLGRYPVTCQEYGEFIRDGGYTRETFWTPEGWAFKNESQIDGPIREEGFDHANQPVTGVSWYEASAYCRWLDARFQEDRPEWLGERFAVGLATEAQWEYAAKGSQGRRYAWGYQAPDDQFARFGDLTLELGLAPVGIYVRGGTPEGLMDLSGNIWEWCVDTYDEIVYQNRENEQKVVDPLVAGDQSGADRVVRGGSWGSSASGLRSASRFWNRPGYRFRYLGFRVCVSPVAVEPG